MARPRIIPIREQLNKMIPPHRLNELAHKTGAVVRERKVEIVDLYWTLILGFAIGRERTLAALRRSYELATVQTLVPSAFYDRFTGPFALFMRQSCEEILDNYARDDWASRGSLESFRELIVTDSTIIRLNDMLEGKYPAARTNHTKAAAKMHVVSTVRGVGLKSIKITSGRRHDGPIFQVGPWVKQKLLLFDLGYFNFSLFARIDRNRGYFISRLKRNVSPVITKVHSVHRGRAIDLVGQRIQDVVPQLKRELIDAEVSVAFKKRPYGGKRSQARASYRLIGRLDENSGNYHLYLTNIPTDKLAADDVAMAYAARWWVELLFKSWKQDYRLEQMPSRKKHIVEALLYSAVITWLVSRRVMELVRAKSGPQSQRVRDMRFTAVFASVAAEVLKIMLQRPSLTRSLQRTVSQLLLTESIDPNAARFGLIGEVENRAHCYSSGKAHKHAA